MPSRRNFLTAAGEIPCLAATPRVRRKALRTFDRVDYAPEEVPDRFIPLLEPLMEGYWEPAMFRDPARWAAGWVEHPADAFGASAVYWYDAAADAAADLVVVRNIGNSMLPVLHDEDLCVVDVRAPVSAGLGLALYRDPRGDRLVARMRRIHRAGKAGEIVVLRAFVSTHFPTLRLPAAEVPVTARLVAVVPWWIQGASLPGPPTCGRN